MTTTNKKYSTSSPSEPSQNLRSRELDKYVWTLLGVLFLFLATFPLACIRVAQSEKFGDQPLNSISWSENQKANLTYPVKD